MVKPTTSDINKQNRLGQTALFRACDKGNLATVRYFLSIEGIDVNLASTSGVTPFYKACYRGHFNVVQELIKRDDVDINKPKNRIANRTDPWDYSPLYVTCIYNRTENHRKVIELLLGDARTNVNRIEGHGKTSFLLSCQDEKIDTVRLFINTPRVDINIPDYERESPLSYAIRTGCLKIVSMIIDTGRVDINGPCDPKGMTPLMKACESGYENTVDMLLSRRDIDVNISTQEGFTALTYACYAPFPETSFYPKERKRAYPSIVKKLLDDPRIAHPRENLANPAQCPLVKAYTTGNDNIFSMLVQDKKFMASKSKFYCLGLLCAFIKLNLQRSGHTKIIKWILATGSFLERDAVRENAMSELRASTIFTKALVISFYKNPSKVKTELRIELGIAGRMASEVFAYVVYYCDDYYRLPAKIKYTEERFFKIASRLPMELQMILCNRLYGLRKDSIPKKLSEPAFVKLAEPASVQS